MSDEHRADVAGYAGDAVVRTPVLDDLARTGVVFENAYTPAPVCVPARQAMAAGQLPRTVGVDRFSRDLPPFSMTFAKRFAQHAYHTACFGKLHHHGPDQMQGWMQRPAGDAHVTRPNVDGRSPDAETRIPEPIQGLGKWSDAKEIHRAGPGRSPWASDDDIALAALERWATDWWFANPYYDRPHRHEPLLLKLSLLRPHYPYLCAEEKFNYYLNRVTPFIEHETFDHPFLSRRQVRPGTDASEREIQRACATYYGMIEELDDRFGQTMRTLEHLGEDLDDWLIIYTTDHGEMLGEHGIWEKKQFFEASARVPLIIRPPRHLRDAWGCEGRVVRENVNLCDLFATLCEMCEVPLPDDEQTVNNAGLDSRSLVPLMRGQTRTWHAAYQNETISQLQGENLMIKRDALKYQWYGHEACAGCEEVLFDLDRDPGERHNGIDDPQYAEAVEAFRQRRDELGFGPDGDANYRNAGYDRAALGV